MTNIIQCKEQVWKNLMPNMIGPEHVYAQHDTENALTSTTASSAIACLAHGKTCGLAMLVDKLLLETKNNASTKHLISTLINRLHYNSITINASTDDDAEKFIMKMISAAMHFTRENEPYRPSSVKAANLLTSAIQKFDTNQVDSETLEYEWKEFLFHFYRSRLKEWAT